LKRAKEMFEKAKVSKDKDWWWWSNSSCFG
jgi:hypothetical protein